MRDKLAIFDMDGTVFDTHLDWLKIREELNIPPGGNILAEIYRGNSVDKKRLEILEKYEKENTLKARPISGIAAFLLYLKQRKIHTALLTNNNKENTFFLLSKYHLDFDLVVTRETGLWKPEPGAFFFAMEKYGCQPEEAISIGDSHYDVQASHRAKVSKIFLIETPRTVILQRENPGIILFRDYVDLKGILEKTREGFLARGTGNLSTE